MYSEIFHTKHKHHARQASVLNTIHDFFHGKVPNQYWTLGAMCGVDCYSLQECEFHHCINTNLIDSTQYHSVEIKENLYKYNVENLPGANWYHGDFLHKIIEVDNQANFHPSVINYDSILMPRNATDYLARLMRFLVARKFTNLIVIANTVWKNPHNGNLQFTTNDEYINYLATKEEIIYALNKGGWTMQNRAYHYNGHDGQRSKMMTTVFTHE